MRIKPFVYAALALGFLAPGPARAMSFGPRISALAVSPSPIPENGTASIACDAYESTGTVTTLTVSVSGGTLPGGGASANVVFTSSPPIFSGTIAWATPSAGSYTVTCAASDGTYSDSYSIPVDVVAAPPPPVVTLAASTAQVFPGEAVQLTATAASPDGSPLTLAWSASGGTLAEAGETATWTAPALAGPYSVTFTATNANGQASASAVIDVVWALPAASHASDATGRFAPERVAVDAEGYLYVTNSGSRAIEVFTPVGQRFRSLRARGRFSGVAIDSGGIWASDLERRAVDLLDREGRRLRSLGAGAGEFSRPADVAVDALTGRVTVVDAGDRSVRVYEGSGALAGTLSAGVGIPVAVAVDGASGRTFVADGGGAVRVLDASGVQIATLGSFGSGPGQLSRPAAVAVGADGNVYVVDALQGRIAAFSQTGTFLAFIGASGFGPGQLAIPLGIAADPRARLVATSTQAGRLEVFGLRGAVAPQCPVTDSDCDGLPNAWETAHGLDPADPRDAWLDSDGDGLDNLQELALGTDPRAADSDGDGYTDGEEVASGFDPLDGADHAPALFASGPGETVPGLVRISSSVRASSGCGYAWAQVGGPSVSLRGADTGAPSFVARAAGTYAIEGTVSCGGQQSSPAAVSVVVLDVPPSPDPGRQRVVSAGSAVVLDGSFTSDANGDVPSFAWDQVLGPPVMGSEPTVSVPLRLDEAGLYGFQLTASDRSASAVAEVPVLVIGARQPPTAVAATPVAGAVGQPVALDASASASPAHPLAFTWVQRAGTPVELTGADTAIATFVAPEPGRYAFEVTAAAGALRSPPAWVDVYVARAGEALPAAQVAPVAGGLEVGTPVVLDGSGSAADGGGAVEHAWRQVAGPAAGLTDADRPLATVVPFAAGTHVFELVVRSGGAVSLPVTVRLEVDAARVPLAIASAPSRSKVKEVVELDGSGSTGPAGATLRHRWTQVSGPWVALEGADSARPTFRPRVPGRYGFELEVDDGEVRSAPAAVSVVVKSRRGTTAAEGQ